MIPDGFEYGADFSSALLVAQRAFDCIEDLLDLGSVAMLRPFACQMLRKTVHGHPEVLLRFPVRPERRARLDKGGPQELPRREQRGICPESLEAGLEPPRFFAVHCRVAELLKQPLKHGFGV